MSLKRASEPYEANVQRWVIKAGLQQYGPPCARSTADRQLTQVVGSHHDTSLELDAQHTGSRHDRLPIGVQKRNGQLSVVLLV